MKLAEALVHRADLQRRIAELQSRIVGNATYQDGDQPMEEPSELLKEYKKVYDELEGLVVAINTTNNEAKLKDGMKMVEALSRRERLKAEHSCLISLADAATPSSRYSRSEIKIVAAVDVKDIRKKADKIAAQAREIDLKIQEANWREDLVK